MGLAIIIILLLFIVYLAVIKPNSGTRERAGFLEGRNIARAGFYDNLSDHPENSLPAFQNAVAAGYAIETQVRMSSDGVLVLFADKNLLRLTGVSTNVDQMSWNDLSTLRILEGKERIVCLDELLTVVGGVTPLVLEVCPDENDPIQMVGRLHEKLRVYQGEYAVESVDKRVLTELRQIAPEIPRGLRAAGPAEDGQSFMSGLLGNFLLSNVQTRPDFVSYYFRNSKNVSLKLCKSFFHVFTLGWTIQNMDDYRKVDRIFDGLIFEHITPSSQFVKGKVKSTVVSPPVRAQSAERQENTQYSSENS